MEQDKYYEPKLEELYLGYITNIQTNKGLQSGCFPDLLLFNEELNQYKEDYTKASHAILKTKYLDKEDIESLGFNLCLNINNILSFKKLVNNYYLIITLQHDIIQIELQKEDKIKTVFEGNLKSINELKKVLEFLNIK